MSAREVCVDVVTLLLEHYFKPAANVPRWRDGTGECSSCFECRLHAFDASHSSFHLMMNDAVKMKTLNLCVRLMKTLLSSSLENAVCLIFELVYSRTV
jgi:hypothetical protein